MKHNLPPLPLDVAGIKKAAFLTRALNHPFRQKMFRLMDAHEALNVTQLYQLLNEQQPVVSSHLSVLRAAGLVEVLPDGKTRWYSVNYERIQLIHNAVDKLSSAKKSYAAGYAAL